jgi:hypothetical protein
MITFNVGRWKPMDKCCCHLFWVDNCGMHSIYVWADPDGIVLCSSQQWPWLFTLILAFPHFQFLFSCTLTTTSSPHVMLCFQELKQRKPLLWPSHTHCSKSISFGNRGSDSLHYKHFACWK